MEKDNIYQISSNDLEQIDELIQKKRYDDPKHFIDKALQIFLAWELDPQHAHKLMKKMEKTPEQFGSLIQNGATLEMLRNFSDKKPEDLGKQWHDYLNANPEIKQKYENLEEYEVKNSVGEQELARRRKGDYENTVRDLDGARNFIKNEKFDFNDNENNEIHYDQWPLLFTHYSRIFPAKIGLFALGELMRKNQSTIVNFDEFKVAAYDLAEEISSKLEDIEEDKEYSRQDKLSTGLPKKPTNNSSIGAQKVYEERYKDRYFGKIRNDRESKKIFLDGLMSSLNLIRVFEVKKFNVNKEKIIERMVTFTEQGKKFYELKNPQFSNNPNKVFYDEEKEFLRDLIQQRELEFILIKSAHKLISSGKIEPDKITEKLDEEFLLQIREFMKKGLKSLKKKILDNEHYVSIETKLQKILDSTDEILKARKQLEPNSKSKSNLKNEEFLEMEAKSKKQTPVEAIRIATLGRMSEIGLTNWDINKGISHYEQGEISIS